MGGDRERLLLPGERRVGEDDRHVGEVHRHVVEVDRVGVGQPDPAAAPGAGAGPGLPGVKQRGQARRLDDLVDRVGHPVVGEERLRARVELEPLDAVLLDLAPGHPDRLGAAVRVDRAERDEHVGVVVPGPLGDFLGGRAGRVRGLVLDVDGERHRRHLPLAVVRGQVIDGERGRRGLEVRGHRGQVLVVFRLDRRRGDRTVHMRVHVDRDQTVDVHGRDYPGAISARHAVITPISVTFNLWDHQRMADLGDWTSDARLVRAFRPSPGVAVDPDVWPATVPAAKQLLREGLELPPGITILVGENGSGKSTVVELLAEAYGLNPQGGSILASSLPPRVRATEPEAGDRLFVERGPGGRAAWAYFLRADTMHSLYTFLEENRSTRRPPER